jgi:hypothetical protein
MIDLFWYFSDDLFPYIGIFLLIAFCYFYNKKRPYKVKEDYDPDSVDP